MWEELYADFRMRSIQLIAELYYKRGLPAEARQVCEQGLAVATKAPDRGFFPLQSRALGP